MEGRIQRKKEINKQTNFVAWGGFDSLRYQIF
jgi:hypothetical protein